MKTRSRQRQQGQSLLEFALILPTILFLIIVLLDASLAVLEQSEATTWADQAAQDGANQAASHGDSVACPTAQAEVRSHIHTLALAPSQIAVSCKVQDTANPANPGSYGRVNTRLVIVTVRFATTLPVIWWVALPYTVTGSATIGGIGP